MRNASPSGSWSHNRGKEERKQITTMFHVRILTQHGSLLNRSCLQLSHVVSGARRGNAMCQQHDHDETDYMPKCFLIKAYYVSRDLRQLYTNLILIILTTR